MAIGMLIYYVYGRHHSALRLGPPEETRGA
jgi:hypothetical protein